MAETLEPDPSMIGGVAQAPFALVPVALVLFQERAKRFAFLAETSELKPYLDFLAALTRLQARLVVQLSPVQPLPSARLAQARAAKMPPLDRAALADDPALHDTLATLAEGAAELAMPEPARLALDALRAADRTDRSWLLGNILSDTIPEDSVAPHLFAAAAVQVHLARLAETLAGGDLVPVVTGCCPACGGRPVTSSVRGEQGVENVRYATCACCATRWNEVRVKCLCCGSTKGITYRSAETHDASVKAECCGECGSWVKILYQVKNPTLDPVADDVGSLGLDMLMKETRFRRAGFNPYLAGY
jgi:FdhE protein